MRKRKQREEEKMELQMTAMIDIVFQLLIFFIMTFKIVQPEGDFNITMPLLAPSEGTPDEEDIPPIKVTLMASSSGNLREIVFGTRGLGTNYGALRTVIRETVGDNNGPSSVAAQTEVEIDSDPKLKFLYLINAVTAISGYVQDGRIVPMIEKIKLTPK